MKKNKYAVKPYKDSGSGQSTQLVSIDMPLEAGDIVSVKSEPKGDFCIITIHWFGVLFALDTILLLVLVYISLWLPIPDIVFIILGIFWVISILRCIYTIFKWGDTPVIEGEYHMVEIQHEPVRFFVKTPDELYKERGYTKEQLTGSRRKKK